MIIRGSRVTVKFPAPLRDARLRSLTPLYTPEEHAEMEAAAAAARAAEAALAAAHDAAIREEATRGERQRLEPLVAALVAANTQLMRRVETLERDAKPQIVELAKAIGSEVVKREVEDGRYNLTAIVQDCFAIARGVEKGAVIYLNPGDYESAVAGGELRILEKENITIKPDTGLARGGCRVETPYGDVLRDMGAAVADVLAAVDGRR